MEDSLRSTIGKGLIGSIRLRHPQEDGGLFQQQMEV